MLSNELNEEYDSLTEMPECNLADKKLIEQIIQAKKERPTQFESYWETDENDINTWSSQQIREDPGKQLLTYAENGNLNELIGLIEKQQDVSKKQKLLKYQDDDGYSAMHRAAYSNNLEIVKYLLSFENRKDMPDLDQLNCKTEMGWTPLHSASYWNAFQIVDYFLKYAKSDVNSKTSGGQTALHLAAQQSTGKETLLILLTHSLNDFDIKNDQGETALQIAQRSSKYNTLFEIAEKNLNLI